MSLDLTKVLFTTTVRYEYIALKGSVVFATSSSNATVTIAHNLGYIPFNTLFLQFAGDPNYYASFAGFGTQVGNWVVTDYHADATNVYISFTNVSGDSSGIVYYRIYAEPLAA